MIPFLSRSRPSFHFLTAATFSSEAPSPSPSHCPYAGLTSLSHSPLNRWVPLGPASRKLRLFTARAHRVTHPEAESGERRSHGKVNLFLVKFSSDS